MLKLAAERIEWLDYLVLRNMEESDDILGVGVSLQILLVRTRPIGAPLLFVLFIVIGIVWLFRIWTTTQMSFYYKHLL